MNNKPLANLRGVDLRGADLRGVNFSGLDLSRADLSQADLRGADLSGARFCGATLRDADFSFADMAGADLSSADFSGAAFVGVAFYEGSARNAIGRQANLRGAFLRKSDLSYADLTDADLSEARLLQTKAVGAKLVRVNLRTAALVAVDARKADLTGASVYGVAAWDVRLDDAAQKDLNISSADDCLITVDDLEVAQFMHLLLRNHRIRAVIDTVTSKVVLLLGRFTPSRKPVLEAVKDELRKEGYCPVIFDFEKPASRDFIETVATLAHMSRFVLADVTQAKIVLEEIPHIVRNVAVPLVPLLSGARREPVTLGNLRRNHKSLLDTFRYSDVESLIRRMRTDVVGPALARGEQIASANRTSRARSTRGDVIHE